MKYFETNIQFFFYKPHWDYSKHFSLPAFLLKRLSFMVTVYFG